MKPFTISKSCAATAAASDNAAVIFHNGSTDTPVGIKKIVGCIFVATANEEYCVIQRTTTAGTASSSVTLNDDHMHTIDRTMTVTGIVLKSTVTAEPTKSSARNGEKTAHGYTAGDTSPIVELEFCFPDVFWIPPGEGVCINSGGSQGISASRWTFHGVLP